jgi:hypothetical protein
VDQDRIQSTTAHLRQWVPHQPAACLEQNVMMPDYWEKQLEKISRMIQNMPDNKNLVPLPIIHEQAY